MRVSVQLKKKITDFLVSLPHIHDSKTQQAVIYGAGLDQNLQDQVVFGGSSLQFVQDLVTTLVQYGTLDDGRSALEAVLENTKTLVGQDKRDYCNMLIEQLHRDIAEEFIATSGQKPFQRRRLPMISVFLRVILLCSVFLALLFLLTSWLFQWSINDTHVIPILQRLFKQEEVRSSTVPIEQGEPYSGERISLNFEETSLLEALHYITEQAGLNLIVHPTITGIVTLRFEDMPWDQALDIILEMNALTAENEDNFILVKPIAMNDVTFLTQLESDQGQRISLHYQQTSIFDVLDAIAQMSDFDIVVHPGVSGLVTVSLTDVPLEQALAGILAVNNATARISGKVITIKVVAQHHE